MLSPRVLLFPLFIGLCACVARTTAPLAPGGATALPGGGGGARTPAGLMEPGTQPNPRGGGVGAGRADADLALDARSPADALRAGLEALDAGDAASAIGYLGRAAQAEEGDTLRDALLGLADAHVALRDFAAAARVHASLLARDDLDRPTKLSVVFAKGALEAELGAWEASAADYARALEWGPAEPSRRVEALVRRGYALFQLDRFDEARESLAEADRVWGESQRDASERFPSLYFVAMGRFYQAAILHRRFLDAPIRLPMAQMKADFDRKLELLDAAQRAYNDTITVKHPYWVSAAGFQLGELFERFYVDVSRSPVPDALSAEGRRAYERELDAQLRPAIEKAMWVHEQNLAAARRLGYATEFVERSERALERLRTIGLVQGDFRALLDAGGMPGRGGAGTAPPASPEPEAKPGAPEAKPGAPEAKPGAPEAKPGGGGDLGAAPPPFVPPMRPL